MNSLIALGRIAGLLLAMVLLAGCSKEGGAVASPKAFDGASPEIREVWNRAVAADQANDYVAALNGYRQILFWRDKLAEGQTKAAEEAAGKLNQRMVNAALAGDAAARKALDTLGAMDRQPH